MQDDWVEVVVSRQPFRFLVGAPLFQFSSQLHPLANGVWLSPQSDKGHFSISGVSLDGMTLHSHCSG